jgi:very-short-patch-repair endonuclease
MSRLTPRARELRQRQTPAEVLLWARLRGAQLGAKFQRQKPIGRFIPGFVCFEHKVIVEADGLHHMNSAYDLERDEWLTAEGFCVLRFWNTDVTENLESVLQTIRNALTQPLPPGRGRR